MDLRRKLHFHRGEYTVRNEIINIEYLISYLLRNSISTVITTDQLETFIENGHISNVQIIIKQINDQIDRKTIIR